MLGFASTCRAEVGCMGAVHGAQRGQVNYNAHVADAGGKRHAAYASRSCRLASTSNGMSLHLNVELRHERCAGQAAARFHRALPERAGCTMPAATAARSLHAVRRH